MDIQLNIYAIIILAALGTNYFLNLIGDYLNVKASSADLPPEFKDVFDQASYEKSREYERVNTRFSLLASTVNLAALLIFWFAGGFVYLDEVAHAWLPGGLSDSVIARGLLFGAMLLLLKLLLGLPWRIYETFIIEARFGFNRTTPAVFAADLLKIILLTGLLGAPLFAALITFFEYAGNMAWLYCWLITTGFTFIVQFIAPRWIMPWFNKFTPLEEGELRRAVENYAAQVNFPIEGLYVIDGSRRSTKSNAFFTGFGKHKRIALYDTLIKNNSAQELVAILAHEIGHYKKNHIIKGLALNIFHTGILFFLLSVFLNSEGLFQAFGFEPPYMPVYAGFVFFGLLYAPIEMALTIALNAYMRKNEREADSFVISTTDHPTAFADALKKLSRDNLANLTPHPFNVILHHSHPPILERVRFVENHSEES